MVELSGKDDPFQHGFPNVVFILPAVVVAGLAGKFRFLLHICVAKILIFFIKMAIIVDFYQSRFDTLYGIYFQIQISLPNGKFVDLTATYTDMRIHIETIDLCCEI